VEDDSALFKSLLNGNILILRRKKIMMKQRGRCLSQKGETGLSAKWF
jgi:hypothetical protein